MVCLSRADDGKEFDLSWHWLRKTERTKKQFFTQFMEPYGHMGYEVRISGRIKIMLVKLLSWMQGQARLRLNVCSKFLAKSNPNISAF